MKTLPTQQRALQKRQALIAAAVREFSSAGFEVATAKSIAAEAGVATGTFYQYFENKNDILRVIAAQRFEYLHEEIPLLPFEELESQSSGATRAETIPSLFEKTLRLVFDFHAQEPALHQVLEQRRELDPELRDIMREGEAVLQGRVLDFVESQAIANAAIVATNLYSMAEGIVHRHVFDQTEFDSELVLHIGAKMLACYFENSALKPNP